MHLTLSWASLIRFTSSQYMLLIPRSLTLLWCLLSSSSSSSRLQGITPTVHQWEYLNYISQRFEGRMNTVTFTNDQSCECVCHSFSLHLCFCLSYYLRNPSPHVFTKWVESKVYNIPVNSWGGKWDCRLHTNGNQCDGKAPLSSFGPRIESLYVVCNGSAAAG